MVDLSKIPDLIAVGFMTCAFASVARRGHNYMSRLWLLGWIMVILHFIAYIFLPAPGFWGNLAAFIGTSALVLTGMLFSWASVPHRNSVSSLAMFASLSGTNCLYIAILSFDPAPGWDLNFAALLIGLMPLAITIKAARRFTHPLRVIAVSLNVCLSLCLLVVQFRPDGTMIALNAILFLVFLSSTLHMWYSYRRATAGAFICVFGFLGWAAVFLVGPFLMFHYPSVHVDDEVWNLPKYVVALGMILLLLEDQIEHNKYLALHDELTGLPNRRLFQDRLMSALERARRTNSRASLLLIDLDRFKEVNDTVGHHIGDLLLKRAADIFSNRVRRSDTVARTGGDEFSIVLEEPTSREDALNVASSLCELLSRPIEIEGHTVRVGASIGIAVFPQDATDAESLCISADHEMYAVKNATRDAEHLASSRRVPRFPPAEAKAYAPAKIQRG